MISEQAIQKIQTGYADSVRPFVMHTPAEPKHVYRVGFPGDGNRAASVGRVEVEPAPRNYQSESLEGLCGVVVDLANKFVDRGGVRVFAGRARVLAILGEDVRRDSVTMMLSISEPFQTLIDASEDLDGIAQADLLWTLKSQFRNNVAPASFLPNLKQMRFKRDTAGTSDMSPGRESLGRQVMAEIVGATGDFPETVTLTCPMYSNLPTAPMATVECALRVNLEQQTFTLKPIDGELDRVRGEFDAWLAKELEGRLNGAAVVYQASGATLA